MSPVCVATECCQLWCSLLTIVLVSLVWFVSMDSPWVLIALGLTTSRTRIGSLRFRWLMWVPVRAQLLRS